MLGKTKELLLLLVGMVMADRRMASDKDHFGDGSDGGVGGGIRSGGNGGGDDVLVQLEVCCFSTSRVSFNVIFQKKSNRRTRKLLR